MKRRNQTFKSQIAEARKSPKYWTAMSAFQFSEGLRRLMAAEGLKQRDLAKLLRRSEAWVSKLLNGSENLTLQKMNEIAMQLGAAVHVHVARQDFFVEWSEVSRDQAYQRRTRQDRAEEAATDAEFFAEELSIPPLSPGDGTWMVGSVVDKSNTKEPVNAQTEATGWIN